jgi:hypothetical protein
MALMRADAEEVLVRRCRGYMQRAGVAVAEPYGVNPDLNDPLASALGLLGITPASRRLLADADLATLQGSRVEAYLDVAEVCLLRSLWGRLYQVDVAVGPRRESLSQLRRDLQERLKDRAAEVQRQWGDYLVRPLDTTSGGVAKLRAL